MLKVKTGENVSNCQIMFPDNGVHPNKFIIMARELVWASRFFNIEIATFNTILIEAIDSWSEYLGIKVEFYIDNKEIENDLLYQVYDNLTEVYDEIDIIRLRGEIGHSCKCCY